MAGEENDQDKKKKWGKLIAPARQGVVQQEVPLSDLSSGSCLYTADSTIVVIGWFQ
jgi:hypothetical protein